MPVRRIHELTPHIVRLVVTLDLFDVVVCDKNKNDVAHLDSSAHRRDDIAPHVCLVKPDVDATFVEASDHGGDSGMVHSPGPQSWEAKTRIEVHVRVIVFGSSTGLALLRNETLQAFPI